MNQYLSDKIKILSFISIIMVLYIHSGFHAYEITGMGLNHYVQEMISGMTGRCAVPLFYIISGYLFFLKVPDGIYFIFEKIKKRIRTLLIPYIISAIFFVAFGALVAIIPGTGKFMNGSVLPLFDNDWVTILVSVFYDTGDGNYPMPMAFQLWFLRDLILLVIFSPVWYLLFKYLKWSWIIIVFALNYFPINGFPVFALFWFSLGGILTDNLRYKYNLTNRVWHLTILFIILCLLELYFPYSLNWKYIKIPIILLGVSSIWFIYDIVVSRTFSLQQHKCLTKACSFTFFIYLFHEPTLNIVRKLIVFILGKNEAGYLISYLVSPWIFAAIAIMAGIAFKKYIPNIYNIAVGGR